MEKILREKKSLKSYLTATNFMIIILIIFYLLDKYLPFPNGYTGFNAWDDSLSPAVNYLMGNCGGLLINYMGAGSCLANGTAVYRQLTSMFMHSFIFHLIANLIGLYFIGNYVEKKFGWWLTYIVYFLVGFMQYLITDPLYAAMAGDKFVEATMPSVGASGGIFALIGLGFAVLCFDIKSFKQIDKPTIIVSAIYGILTTYVVSFGWTTVCHNVSMILGLIFGVVIILPFFILKKGKFSPNYKAQTENSNENEIDINDNNNIAI